jgi:uncharacterized protein (TIGR02145 family)
METKNNIWIYFLIVVGLVLILTNSCKKENNDDNSSGSITDKDGNVYTSVTIGTQTWMLENLKTTKYNDGTDIPKVTDDAIWASLTTPAYCWQKNDEATYKNRYGALYNWFVVKTGKLAPKGWHVPTDADWTTLEIYLQNHGFNYDGIIDVDNDRSTNNKTAISLAKTTEWPASQNVGALGNPNYPSFQNKSGFTALPGGYRYSDGRLLSAGASGLWWSSTEYSAGQALYRLLRHDNSDFLQNNVPETNGMSVRCIKD